MAKKKQRRTEEEIKEEILKMPESELEKELDICPLLSNCIPEPDDEMIENYCVINYCECEIYLQYRKNNHEAD
jgi:hypothetical protein